MKKLITIIFFFLLQNAYATVYFVSNAGNDENNGTSTSTSWRTINKVNSTSFLAGDSILFKRGDTFYGSLRVKASGTFGIPIIFGAYENGANPTISGFTKVTSWTHLGSNIWESTGAVSTLSTCNMVVINRKNTPMGRYPNTGYLTYQSHVNNTSITSSLLTSTPGWTGADAAIRVNRWTVNRVTVKSQFGGTLNFDAMSGNGTDKFGFFIENDARTLDAQNEWYFNPSTKKIRVYNKSQPTNVMVATVDTVISVMHGRNYIEFENIAVQGANQILLFSGGNDANILNCSFSFSGWDGLKMAGNYNNISNNIFADIGENGVYLYYGSPGYNVVSKNVFRRTNLITGVLENDYCAAAIRCYSANTLIQYNDIDSSGYCGIEIRYNNVQVTNNLINHSALVRDDAGGIYTGFANETGKVIDGNIILNTIGNYDGTNSKGYAANGIYIDDLGTGVTVTNNTIANCNNTGIFLHNANNCNLRNNTIYNCGTTPAVFTKGALFYKHEAKFPPMTNNTIKNNIFFSKEQGQIPYFSSDNNIDAPISYGAMDSNYYAKPLSKAEDSIFSVNSSVLDATAYYNLAQWQSTMGMDAHSKGSPKLIKDVNDLRFEYNARSSAKIIVLDAKYIDVKGKKYNGSITLAPYASAILIRDDN